MRNVIKMNRLVTRIISVVLAIILCMSYTTSVYGVDETYDCDVDGHIWNEWTVVEEPTCQFDGQKERTCSICGEQEFDSIPKVEHEWSKWIVEEEADCDNVGSKYRVCDSCGEEEYQDIPKLNHKWSSWKVTKKPTHFAYGSKYKKCTRCGKTTTSKIEKRAYTKNEKKAVATTNNFLKEFKNYSFNTEKYQTKKLGYHFCPKKGKIYSTVKKTFKSKFKYKVVNVYPSGKYIKVKVKETYPDAYDATNLAFEDFANYYLNHPW